MRITIQKLSTKFIPQSLVNKKEIKWVQFSPNLEDKPIESKVLHPQRYICLVLLLRRSFSIQTILYKTTALMRVENT